MNEEAYWHLCDELTVKQAASLMAGLLPRDSYDGSFSPNEAVVFFRQKRNMNAAGTAITNAIAGGHLTATVRLKGADNENPDRDSISPHTIDWDLTTIAVQDLREWLKARGMKPAFFFPQSKATLDFLDPENKHYAPKLAAAVNAWNTVSSEPKLSAGKTVKKALENWLQKNADQFGLIKEDGSINKQGIEEIAKISNWNAKGGAPKTPG